jgi:hypothetical protein
MGPDEDMKIPEVMGVLQDPAVAVMVCPANCNVTLLAEMSIPSAPGAHGPTSVAREYWPGWSMTIGHVLWVIVIVVPALAGEAESRMIEIVASKLRPRLAFRTRAGTANPAILSMARMHCPLQNVIFLLLWTRQKQRALETVFECQNWLRVGTGPQ